jgi:hypothetical protein
MALDEKIEAIEKIGKAFKADPLHETDTLERVSANKEHFHTFLNQGQEHPAYQTTVDASKEIKKVSSISLMDEITRLNSQVSQLKRLNPEEIRNYAKDIVGQMEKVKGNLNDLHGLHTKASDLHGKEMADASLSSQQRRMQQRLTHIDESLKIALSKAGVEYQAYVPQPSPSGRTNPVKNFLGFLTNSQVEMNHLDTKILEMSANRAELKPVEMMKIQMEMNRIQQQLELFTSALNKCLESMKTLMNVQV